MKQYQDYTHHRSHRKRSFAQPQVTASLNEVKSISGIIRNPSPPTKSSSMCLAQNHTPSKQANKYITHSRTRRNGHSPILRRAPPLHLLGINPRRVLLIPATEARLVFAVVVNIFEIEGVDVPGEEAVARKVS